MATLEKIRSKGGLLVLIIGLALLAFIVGDFLNSGVTYFNSSRENVLDVAGEAVNIRDFETAVAQMTEVYKIETGQNDLSEEIQSQIRNSVYESFVNERLMNLEAKKLGLTVTPEELSDRLIGNNIHPIMMQRRVFVDQNGQFSRQALLAFYGSLDQEVYDQQSQEQLRIAQNYWLYWEKAVKNSILQEKFNNLMVQSVTANNVDAKAAFDNRQVSGDFNYIVQPYYMVPDSLVSVSEREIKDRYNKEKENFKQEDSRSLDYVVFELKPMADDYTQIQEWMDKVSEEFRTTDDFIGVVNSNSDVMYDGYNYSEKTVPALLKDFAFKGKEGDFFGPVFQDDVHTMARIMQTGIIRSDSVLLRHIALMPTDEARADSIVNVLRTNKNADFATLARTFSLAQTRENGGEMGWLIDGMKIADKELLVAFDKKEGEVFTIKNPQGIQIVQVAEKTPALPKVKLAILERKVTPSSRTQARIFNDAKQFASNAKDLQGFTNLAEEKGVSVLQAENLDKNTDRIANMPQSRQIVRWANGGKLGDVSDVFDLGEQFVIAVISEINEKGYMPLDKVSAQIKAEILKDKKADYMIKNIDEKIATVSTIEELANQLDLGVKEADKVTFASYQFGTAGFEPYVIGKAMGLPVDKLSKAIKGNSGVFVLLPLSFTQNSSVEFNAANEISELNGYNMYSLPYLINENMRKNTKIVDNRSNFY